MELELGPLDEHSEKPMEEKSLITLLKAHNFI